MVFLRLKEFFGNISYCVKRDCHVYSKHYSAEPRVYQPDPPGLIHDAPRLPPPWRGSSLVWGKYSSPVGPLLRPAGRCGKPAIRMLCERWAPTLCTGASLSTDAYLGLVSKQNGPAEWADVRPLAP